MVAHPLYQLVEIRAFFIAGLWDSSDVSFIAARAVVSVAVSVAVSVVFSVVFSVVVFGVFSIVVISVGPIYMFTPIVVVSVVSVEAIAGYAKKEGWLSLFYGFAYTLLLLFAYGLLFYSRSGEFFIIFDINNLLLLLLLLPLINAVIDWFSLGVTRGLLYSLVYKQHTGWEGVRWSFYDFLLAIFLFFLMAGTLTVAVSLANKAVGVGHSVFDLHGLFKSLERGNVGWKDVGWLYAMLLTTLLPTLLHLLVASLALILSVPMELMDKISNRFERLNKEIAIAQQRGDSQLPTDSMLINASAAYLSFALLISLIPLVILVYVIGLLFQGDVHSFVGYQLLSYMSDLATWIDPPPQEAITK